MDLTQAMQIAAAGMKVQGARMRLVAQNLANADSTALGPGGKPYRRQTITFANQLDRELGVERVRIARIGVDVRPNGITAGECPCAIPATSGRLR